MQKEGLSDHHSGIVNLSLCSSMPQRTRRLTAAPAVASIFDVKMLAFASHAHCDDVLMFAVGDTAYAERC
jgi:hypothetical protein